MTDLSVLCIILASTDRARKFNKYNILFSLRHHAHKKLKRLEEEVSFPNLEASAHQTPTILRITAMNLSALDVLPCAETRLSSPGEMEQYVEVTGDLEGVTLNSTSALEANACPRKRHGVHCFQSIWKGT